MSTAAKQAGATQCADRNANDADERGRSDEKELGGGGGGNRTRVHAYEKRAMARVQGLRRFGRRPASVAASGGHEADGALEKVFRCLLVPEFQTILLEARHSHWKASPTATDVRAAIWQAKTSVAPGRSSSSSAPVG